MRWVKPSIATVSPSRTSSAIASRIDATFEMSIVDDTVTRRGQCERAVAQPAASTSWIAPASWRARQGRRRRGRATARRPPRRRSAARSSTSASLTVRAGDIRTLDVAGTRGRAGRARSTPTGRPRRARRCRTRRRASGPCRGRRARGRRMRSISGRRPASACSPRAAALSIRPPSSRSIVASAAAQATGLPPNVEPWRARAPGLEQVGAGDHRAERHARRDALGREQDVGLDAPVLDRPHLPGPAGARLDLVGDEQDAVVVADVAQALAGSRPRGRRSRPRPGSARR